MAYRRLEKGEIIQEGDETDRCADPWRDDPVWEPAGNIGEPAPDPSFPSHRQYRRPACDKDYWLSKQLIWHSGRAETPFGVYSITSARSKKGTVWLWTTRGGGDTKCYASAEKAQAAAQADFERRVGGCLEGEA